MCALYSRKNDATRSGDQSSGVGEIAKYVGSSARSSGPGESQ
jgi:hypothetical protein